MPVYETHPVNLTATERADRAMHASALIEEVAKMEESAKLAAKMTKEDIDAKKVELRAFSRAAHTGIEDRTIAVRYQSNLERFTVETINDETGEVVATRPMNDGEQRIARQAALPFKMPEGNVTPIREAAAVSPAEGFRQPTGGTSPLRGTTRNGVTT